VSNIADTSLCHLSFGSFSRSRGSTALFLLVEGFRSAGRALADCEGDVRHADALLVHVPGSGIFARL